MKQERKGAIPTSTINSTDVYPTLTLSRTRSRNRLSPCHSCELSGCCVKTDHYTEDLGGGLEKTYVLNPGQALHLQERMGLLCARPLFLAGMRPAPVTEAVHAVSQAASETP